MESGEKTRAWDCILVGLVSWCPWGSWSDGLKECCLCLQTVQSAIPALEASPTFLACLRDFSNGSLTHSPHYFNKNLQRPVPPHSLLPLSGQRVSGSLAQPDSQGLGAEAYSGLLREGIVFACIQGTPRSRCQRISSHRLALESLWPTQTKLEFGDCAL